MTHMDIKIMIAAHKKCWIPEDEMYLPIHVGKALSKEEFGYTHDDTGANISDKNPVYCELTAVYWAWKNLTADYIGLVHYGRLFAGKQVKRHWVKDKRPYVLKQKELAPVMHTVDVILPKRRKYYIETLYSHYAHSHGEEQLKMTRQIIEELCPEYLDAFDIVMKRTWGNMFNMFIMKQEYFQQYCGWLFPILEELEQRIDTSEMSAFEKRYIGRISECLMNVWIEKERIQYREMDWIYLRKINYFKKGISFLKAKFFHKKYKSSF